MSDNPIRPSHYQGEIETFDYMQDKMSTAFRRVHSGKCYKVYQSLP